jgi:putative tributyrin esterase
MALHEIKYFSGALQKATGAFVIHPDPSVPRPYHCMVLMHGLSDDYTIWQRRTSIERYVEGKPLVVVMPDGGRGFYVNALQGYQYLDAIADELPDLMNHWFRIDGKWCTAGLSMGGYGALRIALEHPGLFRSCVSHSGAMMIGNWYPSKQNPRDQSKWDDEFLSIFGDVKENSTNDLIKLCQKADPLPAIRFDCGTEDFLLSQNREFHKQLTDLGIKHEYEEFPGDHNWAYWDKHVQEAITFNLKNLSK